MEYVRYSKGRIWFIKKTYRGRTRIEFRLSNFRQSSHNEAEDLHCTFYSTYGSSKANISIFSFCEVSFELFDLFDGLLNSDANTLLASLAQPILRLVEVIFGTSFVRWTCKYLCLVSKQLEHHVRIKTCAVELISNF